MFFPTRVPTWCRGRPTMEGKTARGASSPANPALQRPEPLSQTRAVVSSSHMVGPGVVGVQGDLGEKLGQKRGTLIKRLEGERVMPHRVRLRGCEGPWGCAVLKNPPHPMPRGGCGSNPSAAVLGVGAACPPWVLLCANAASPSFAPNGCQNLLPGELRCHRPQTQGRQNPLVWSCLSSCSDLASFPKNGNKK